MITPVLSPKGFLCLMYLRGIETFFALRVYPQSYVVPNVPKRNKARLIESVILKLRS